MHEELYQKCRNMSADEIREYLISDEAADSIYMQCDGILYKLCDIASLFVAAAYISCGENSERASFRKNAYIALLSEDRSAFSEAWRLIDLLTKNIPYESPVSIRILKGGSYKIKNYYLENYLLNDIRGASVLLTHVEEDIIPAMISDKYIPECIVYSGGGNIFAIVPESCDEAFALELETRGKELLISADIAYYVSEKLPFSDIFGENYKEKMAEVENSLNERKKLIVNCSAESKTSFLGKSIPVTADTEEESFNAPVTAKEVSDRSICSACGKRIAFYSVGDKKLCASCLHKRSVGSAAKRSRYIKLYNKYNSDSERKAKDGEVKDLSDIVIPKSNSADSKGYIAIVYGDGNNMGGIIQNFRKITQMMEFSRDVKTITAKAAFEAMGENEITKFEVAGLGGDDIFVIVDGRKAIHFTISLINKYNKQFEKYKSRDNVSTLSAGIAIAKCETPIQVVLEKAENELQKAKSIAKQKQDNCGSLSFVIMDTFDGGDSVYAKKDYKVTNTMLPYYTDTAEDIVKFALEMKENKSKTGLRNVLDAFENAESTEEAELFLRYMNAKEKNKIELADIRGYEKSVGYYIRNGRKYYIWNDLITILDFID